MTLASNMDTTVLYNMTYTVRRSFMKLIRLSEERSVILPFNTVQATPRVVSGTTAREPGAFVVWDLVFWSDLHKVGETKSHPYTFVSNGNESSEFVYAFYNVPADEVIVADVYHAMLSWLDRHIYDEFNQRQPLNQFISNTLPKFADFYRLCDLCNELLKDLPKKYYEICKNMGYVAHHITECLTDVIVMAGNFGRSLYDLNMLHAYEHLAVFPFIQCFPIVPTSTFIRKRYMFHLWQSVRAIPNGTDMTSLMKLINAYKDLNDDKVIVYEEDKGLFVRICDCHMDFYFRKRGNSIYKLSPKCNPNFVKRAELMFEFLGV